MILRGAVVVDPQMAAEWNILMIYTLEQQAALLYLWNNMRDALLDIS